jgi:hypothetical protein
MRDGNPLPGTLADGVWTVRMRSTSLTVNRGAILWLDLDHNVRVQPDRSTGTLGQTGTRSRHKASRSRASVSRISIPTCTTSRWMSTPASPRRALSSIAWTSDFRR